jgi:hypothetical protein
VLPFGDLASGRRAAGCRSECVGPDGIKIRKSDSQLPALFLLGEVFIARRKTTVNNNVHRKNFETIQF